jgi:branched-subunit amino acid permease
MGISPRADGSFSYDLQLIDGPNIISIIIKDKAGNTASETIQVTKLKAPKTTVAKGFIPGFEGLATLAAIAAALTIFSTALRHRKS